MPYWYNEIALWLEFPKLIPWDDSEEMPLYWRNRIQSFFRMRELARKQLEKENRRKK